MQSNSTNGPAMINYITAAWHLKLYVDALWQYEEAKLRASNIGFSVFDWIQKQARNPTVQLVIQKQIENIENH